MEMVRVFYTFLKEQDGYEVRFNKSMVFVPKGKWNQFIAEQNGRKNEGTSFAGQLSVDLEDLENIVKGEYEEPIPYELTAEQWTIFRYVHNNHLKAYWEDGTERPKRTFDHITNIKWVDKERCLHVHYDDGEWWHYLPDGTWY